MEQPRRVSLGYSLKNIPTPSANSYRKRLIEMTERFIKRMRWRAFFFLRGAKDDDTEKENFGFQSRKSAPHVEELRPFEEDLLKLIGNVRFRRINDDFQQTLKKDISKIKTASEIFVPADKTRNLYGMGAKQYEKLLKENITKHYKLAPDGACDDINLEAKEIAQSLGIEDRIDVFAKREAFLTLKDHKENFANNLPCRLINPAKSEMGAVSKRILDKATMALKKKLEVRQWKNSMEVIEWFRSLKEKDKCTFTCFDIVEFYPSITEELLTSALSFARQHTEISDDDVNIIYHARKSLLFSKGKAWMKRTGTSMFDVTMGSYDGAEVCELVGTFILVKLGEKFPRKQAGLYRDDGLAISRRLPGRAADRNRKEIIKMFEDLGLKITIQVNLKIVHFLDVTFDLDAGKHYPYRKPNDTPLYINKLSDHPPQILKNLPAAIGRRISRISSDKDSFDQAAPLYNNALKNSGHSVGITYTESPEKARSNNRQRRIIWFNPPYSRSVATNIGKKFLGLISRHFPKGSKLNKIFNRNTVKVSYSCMPNVAAIIKGHNSQITQRHANAESSPRRCNCRRPAECPLNGDCLTNNVVYKAMVKTTGPDEVREYIGLAETEFKLRYANHLTTFRHESRQNSTELSKYIWQLKRSNVDFEISWAICQRAPAYSNTSKRCNLCLTEKVHLLTAGDALLNKRSEITSKCRHESKFYLSNFQRGVT